jgi:hypothetical protein
VSASGPDDSVPAVVSRLREVREGSGITYAFGGAIALAAWSEPRATADVDVILWIDPEEPVELDRAIEVVRSAGAELDAGAALDGARTRGMFLARIGATRCGQSRR